MCALLYVVGCRCRCCFTQCSYIFMQRFAIASSSRKAVWRHSTRGKALHTEMVQLQLGPSTWHTHKVYRQLFTRQFPLQTKQDAGDIIQRGRRMQVPGKSTHASG